MAEVLEFQPDLVEDGQLRVELTKDSIWLLFRSIHQLNKRVMELEGSTGSSPTEVTASAGTIVWIDIDLTANHTVVAPVVDIDTFVIWRFFQNGGTFTLTWPDANFPTAARIGSEPNKYSYVGMRAVASLKFELVFLGISDAAP
jgi:hypothetical protein